MLQLTLLISCGKNKRGKILKFIKKLYQTNSAYIVDKEHNDHDIDIVAWIGIENIEHGKTISRYLSWYFSNEIHSIRHFITK